MTVHNQSIERNGLNGVELRPLVDLKGYLLSALTAVAGLAIRSALDPLWGDRLPYAIFFLANLFLIRFVALGPFIFTVLAGFILGDWFFVQPRHSLVLGDPVNHVNAILYFVINFIVLC